MPHNIGGLHLPFLHITATSGYHWGANATPKNDRVGAFASSRSADVAAAAMVSEVVLGDSVGGSTSRASGHSCVASPRLQPKMRRGSACYYDDALLEWQCGGWFSQIYPCEGKYVCYL